jgi:hypothetical protein
VNFDLSSSEHSNLVSVSLGSHNEHQFVQSFKYNNTYCSFSVHVCTDL